MHLAGGLGAVGVGTLLVLRTPGVGGEHGLPDVSNHPDAELGRQERINDVPVVGTQMPQQPPIRKFAVLGKQCMPSQDLSIEIEPAIFQEREPSAPNQPLHAFSAWHYPTLQSFGYLSLDKSLAISKLRASPAPSFPRPLIN